MNSNKLSLSTAGESTTTVKSWKPTKYLEYNFPLIKTVPNKNYKWESLCLSIIILEYTSFGKVAIKWSKSIQSKDSKKNILELKKYSNLKISIINDMPKFIIMEFILSAKKVVNKWRKSLIKDKISVKLSIIIKLKMKYLPFLIKD